MALSADRNTQSRPGDCFSYPVLTGVTLYAGALVVLDANGYAKPGVTATGLIAVGRAEERVSNTGASGSVSVLVRRGVYQYKNSAGADEITQANVGDDGYIVDDETVAKTDGTATRSVVGKVMAVDPGGVWVRLGI
ncbi:MAG: hypothetical protein HQM03_22075 [Magnetococcales bacterium]|nr:hypothetical protein [Magnetococcales bacterium]MBF0182710.1 hypothetical protein [Magnetococcales bacterium]